MRKSQFYINQLLAKNYLKALGKIAVNPDNNLSEKQKMTLYDHDRDLKRPVNRFSPYSDVKTNLIKQIEIMEKYGQQVAKSIKDINSYISYDLGYINVYYYSLMVSTANYKMTIDPNGQIIVTNKCGHSAFKMYRSAISKLNRYLHRINSPVRIVISAIEHTYSTYDVINPFNVHAHLLVASVGTPINARIGKDGLNQFEKYLAKYLDNVTVTVTPIRNRITGHDVVINGDAKPSDLDAITGYIKYILKQKKLPIAKTYEDVDAFKALPLSEQRHRLEATLNSTNGVTLHNHMNYKSFIDYVRKVADVISFIAWYHVMEANYHVQMSLFDARRINDQDGMDYYQKLSKHHGTTKENTFRFYGLNRYTGRPLQSHQRHISRQGHSHISHYKVVAKATDDRHGQSTTSGHKVREKLKIYENHVDKQTLFNNKEVNTT